MDALPKGCERLPLAGFHAEALGLIFIERVAREAVAGIKKAASPDRRFHHAFRMLIAI